MPNRNVLKSLLTTRPPQQDRHNAVASRFLTHGAPDLRPPLLMSRMSACLLLGLKFRFNFGSAHNKGRAERFILLSVFSCALIAICAQASLPITETPLQSFGVILVGTMVGFWPALIGTILWLCLGALGLGVFLNGTGLDYMTGPTAGYLFGSVISAGLVGRWADRGGLSGDAVAAGLKLFGLALTAHTVIAVFGLIWLSQFVMTELTATNLMSVQNIFFGTLKIGLLPFVWGWIVQSFVLAILLACVHSALPESTFRDELAQE